MLRPGPGSGSLADPYRSVDYGVNQPTTVDGDCLSVAPGEYVEMVDIGLKKVSIVSQAGPLATTIRASQSGVVISVGNAFLGPTVLVQGFTILGDTSFSTTGAWSEGLLRLKGCVLAGHMRGAYAGYAIFLDECTIVGNEEGVWAPLLGALSADNTIIWGNGGNTEHSPYMFSYCVLEPSAVPSGVGAGQSVVGDPAFWQPELGNYRLRPGSPAIDSGNPSSPKDPDGSRIDVGALTYEASYAPGPNVYCTSKRSSDGCLGQVSTSGAAGFSQLSPFVIRASGLSPNKNGLFFYGFAASPFPYQGGWLCVTPPTVRTQVQSSGAGLGACDGSFTLDFNAYLADVAPPFVNPGDLIYGQYWLRDPQDPFGSVRTDAVEFGLTE